MMSSLIQVQDLSKHFISGGGILNVLRGINFTVEEGEFLSIVGQSGAGKSTLLHIMGALDQPDDGAVVFSETRDAVLERWSLVRGGVELLDGEAARLFTGVVVSGVGFSALIDDERAVRRDCAGAQLVIERPSLEDIMFHLTRRAADPQGRAGAASDLQTQPVSEGGEDA